MSQESSATPRFFHKDGGLQERTVIKKILPGERLFVVENRKKGVRIANLFPDDEVISTEGIPLEVSFTSLEPNNLEYKVSLSPKGEKLRAEIAKRIQKIKVVFILTDTSNRGEAIAQGLLENMPELEGKTNRIKARSLERKALQSKIEQEGILPPDRWGKPDSNKASSHWTRSVMDITWKRKVSTWVEEAARILRYLHETDIPPKAQESLSRLQCSILHLLHIQESARTNYRGYRYWTVKTRMMGSIPGSSLEAHIAVPNLALLERETNPLSIKLWQEKMDESVLKSREGIGIPQREPGSPWRFDTEEEAINYRHNMRRYPLFTLETSETWEEEIIPIPAHSTSTILEKTYKQGWGKQKEAADVLKDLYLAGLITQPKTGSGNLSESSFEQLWKFAVSQDIKLCREMRKFHADIPGQEAIQPTQWAKTPSIAGPEIARSTTPPKVPLAERMYQEIYEQAIKSQFVKNTKKILQLSIVGPLPSTPADAFKGEFIQKESLLKSLMNVVFTGKISDLEPTNSLFSLRKNSLLQAAKVWVEEHETNPPTGLNREELFLQMQKENLGKLETLTALIPKMEASGLLEEREGYIHLTQTGKATIKLLNEYLGNFIHQKYHEVVENQLKEIERGKVDPNGFLQYWWKCLCEVADQLPPIPEAIADSSGKTLQEIETRIQNQIPKAQSDPGMEMAG